MSSIRLSFVLLTALQALSACANHPDSTAPTGPAVPMPQLSAAIANSTPEEARRAISNKTWLWTLGGGPYQVHYSTADGRDFAWLVGESRSCRPAGTAFEQMADRESGDPLHLLDRTQAQFVLTTPPSNLAQVEAQVVNR